MFLAGGLAMVQSGFGAEEFAAGAPEARRSKDAPGSSGSGIG